jgi:aminopeptidase N
MHKNIFYCFYVIFSFVPVFVAAQHNTSGVPFYKDEFLLTPDESSRFKSLEKERTDYGTWDLHYNRLELELDPSKKFISGSIYFAFSALADQLQSITIDLADEMELNSLVSEGRQLHYQRMGHQLIITLPKVLSAGEQASFTVHYSGVPPSSGFGSFTSGIHSNNIPVLFTLSEPYGAREWWPCKQSLIDKIDSIDVIARSPMPYETASNGLLIENSIEGNVRTCHWRHRHPIATYLVFVSTTDYEIYSDFATLDDGSKVEILNYVYPESLETAKKQTPFTGRLIELYSELFIDYPFKNEKYGHAQFGWGGGMEHQTMSSMGGFSTSLIAHELAHQWFGDYITCGSWQEIWLNEGFATYLTGLYYEHLNPDWWYRWKEAVIEKVTSNAGGSVWVADTSSVNRIFDSRLSYNKGAYLLHMLRGQLGDEAFYDGIRHYLNDERVADGFATTHLLRENLEAAADTSLGEFFNDWLYGEGHPLYNIEVLNAQHQLRIDIQQAPSVVGGPFFEMKIPLSLYKNGTREMIWVPNTSPEESIIHEMTYSPDSVVVDEDLWLLGTLSYSYSSSPILQNGSLKIYVNHHEQTLVVDLPGEEKATLSIYNINGQFIEKALWETNNRTHSIQSYRRGMYLLLFRNDHQSLSARFYVP